MKSRNMAESYFTQLTCTLHLNLILIGLYKFDIVTPVIIVDNHVFIFKFSLY